MCNTRSKTLSYPQSASNAQETFATSNLDSDFGAITTSIVRKHAMMYKYIRLYMFVLMGFAKPAMLPGARS